MSTTLIPPTDLPSWAKLGVLVNGVPVYRTRSAWIVCPTHQQQLLQEIFRTLPAEPGERLRSGCLCGANYSGTFTTRQVDALNAATRRLVAAARRATRPDRDARRAARLDEGARRVRAAFP